MDNRCSLPCPHQCGRQGESERERERERESVCSVLCCELSTCVACVHHPTTLNSQDKAATTVKRTQRTVGSELEADPYVSELTKEKRMSRHERRDETRGERERRRIH